MATTYALQQGGQPLLTENLIMRAIRTGNESVESVKRIAAKVYSLDMQKVHGTPMDRQIEQYLSIILTMLTLKGRVLGMSSVLGPNTTHGIDGLIGDALAAEMALHERYSQADMDALHAAHERLRQNPDDRIYFEPVDQLHRVIHEAQYMEAYASRFASRSSQLAAFTDVLVKAGIDLAAYNDETAAELGALRRYGVKPAVFQDGLLHDQKDAWVLLPPPGSVISRGITAITLLAGRDDIVDLTYSVPDPAYPDRFAVSMKHGYQVKSVITTSGDLVQNSGYTAIPSRDLMKKSGAQDFYEFFRLIQLTRLFDLVVPLQTVNRLPGRKVAAMRGPELLRAVRVAKTLMPSFLIPRLKALQDASAMARQLEREVEQADATTIKRSSVDLRRHGVVGHIRQLPKGHHPSAGARKSALEEIGIVLADNETYVRPHKRGSGDEILKHKAVRRT